MIESVENESTPKSNLTGIPQIDYIWDPNLPRELNGFNLSDYPFLNSVPTNEEIAFDCHDVHNGFYASIKYNCQVNILISNIFLLLLITEIINFISTL